MSDPWRVVPKAGDLRRLASGIVEEFDGTSWAELYRPDHMTAVVPPNVGPYQKPAKKEGER